MHVAPARSLAHDQTMAWRQILPATPLLTGAPAGPHAVLDDGAPPQVAVRVTPEAWIVVASFQEPERANRAQARFMPLLGGLPLSVIPAEVSGQTWHRLSVGPLTPAVATASLARLRQQVAPDAWLILRCPGGAPPPCALVLSAW
ncbi:MAG: SPOR domain-containing protein [Alphaproteobacteria bacterium]